MTQFTSPRKALHLFVLFAAGIVPALLAGCGSGLISGDGATALDLQGSVQGGLQPVSGATIQIYAASTKGAGTSAVKMSSSKISTNSNGSFSLPSNFKCNNANDQIYVVATGGNPGGGTNSDLALMTGLGTCSKLTSSTKIYINEITTIASVYALARFMSPNSFDIASSSSDASAVASAYYTAGTIANLGTGNAITTAQVYTKLNSLADSVATCVNSTSGSNACKSLFAAATAVGGSAPTNTISAVLSIAQNPTNNVKSIYNLASTVPFQPTLASSPTDWALFGSTNVSAGSPVTPVITWAAPSAITYGTALSGAQLNASTSVAGTFVYSPVAGTVPNAGAQTLSVTFNPSDTTRYATQTATVNLVVNKATPTLTWATPSPITAGTALSLAQLNATANIAGTFAYSPAMGTVPQAGTATLSASFTPGDATNYTTASKTVSLQVQSTQKKTPVITWATPAPVNYGTALSTAQLNATSSVSGTFTYSPAVGTVPQAGANTLSVTFTPTDTTTYSSSTATVNLQVNKATPTVTWATPAEITYGTALSSTQLDATANIAGTLAYTPAVGTVLSAGTQALSVTFTPTDTNNYVTATRSVSLTVNGSASSITWATPAAITYGTALSSSQLNATAANVPGTFTYSPAAGTVLGAGTQALSVTFTPTDSSVSAQTATVNLVVNKATPVITWPAPAAIAYGTALSSTQLNATANVPGTFVYTPHMGSALTAGTTTLSVTFTPNDEANYATATATVNLTVNSGGAAITWPNPAAITYGTALSATQLNATSSVPGSFVYSPAIGTVLTAGTQTLTATFTPTDTTNYSTQTVSTSLVVNKAAPVITWATPAAITVGTVLSSTQLNATANIPGTFAYSPADGTVPQAGTDTLSVTFTPNDTTNYSTQTATVSLTVNSPSVPPVTTTPTTPTITWATPAAITYGTALSSAQLNATASVPGTFAYSPASGTALGVGTQALKVTFTPTDTTSYTSATATVSLVVNKATPAITWAAPAAITTGTALSSTQLNASASVAGTFAYSPASGTVLSAGTQALKVTFTPNDTTDYNTATASVSLVVSNNTTPTITWATPAAIAYGTALSSTQLNATASVAGTFAYSPASGTVLTAGTQTLKVTFTPTNTSYSAQTATVSLVVNKATPTITWTNPLAIIAGTALSSTQLNATASVAGTFTYSPTLGTVLTAATNTLTATFTPNDTTNYTTATASVTLSITGGSSSGATDIAVGSTPSVTGVKRFGMNMTSQAFYDSGQMLRNLVFKNPGFEAEQWQTIMKCVTVTATSCTDSNPYAQWPANFVQGASFEFIYGAAFGQKGTVTSSTAASYSGNTGVTINFAALSTPPKVGDFVVVKMSVPGNAQAGWWTNVSGGATLTAELSDLSPNTVGKQALRITAGAGQSADVSSYFDTYTGRSFLQLNGKYTIAFRAKGVGGANQVTVTFQRVTGSGNLVYFYQTIPLTGSWQDYSFTASANETGTSIGNVQLSFDVNGSSILLDDVSLTPVAVSTSNPTPFRDEVVSALTALHPGVLRYWDPETTGTTIDNLIAPPYARLRAGSSEQITQSDDVALGLHEFLQLCQTIGAEPYFNMPAGMSPTEMQNLIEYLGGSSSTTYGAKRAARGQAAPWTSVFPVIHLELGNEQWNDAVFHGATINDPVAYGQRIAAVFGAAKSSSSYSAQSFDLVMGSWAAVPWYTGQEASNSANYDSVSVAPYLFNNLSDTSSTEAIFGSMFAQPEMVDSVSSGYMYQQAQAAKTANSKVVVYEVNLSTLSGTADQNTLNAVVGSVGSGLTTVEHMLLMLRDLGITTQNIWALNGYNNQFNNTASGGSETTPLFGSVIDMGGQSNLRRPNFLAEQLANSAILSTLLPTTLSGANPTWGQALSANDSIQLSGAHTIQSFAFSDGVHSRSIIVFNLSRTAALPVTFSGPSVPTGTVNVGQLTSAKITDNNETTGQVGITNSTISNFQASTPYSLPPFSMTVLTWQQ